MKKLNQPTILAAIHQITEELLIISDTPRLDAELLTAAVVQHHRSWLFAHGEYVLHDQEYLQLQNFSMRRANGEPIAYILGYKEFWELKLSVNAQVLVPRPETEHLIEWVLAHLSRESPLPIADLGTGSGAIALALASERPSWQIDATDQSLSALNLAKQNAARHRLGNVNFYLGDWCAALPKRQYALIISNPPYIAENDPHLASLTHEPIMALTSGADGLDAIRHIIAQAPGYLNDSGYLVLEHGYNQVLAITQLLEQQGFTEIQSHRDLANQPRFVTARVITYRHD